VSVPTIKPIDRPQRLVYQVAERLRAMILDGTLEPGTELGQVRLAADLGVSRTPLREAFRVLERDGLIKSIGGNRSVVVELDDKTMLEMLQIREALDGLAARLAAGRSQSAEVLGELTEAAEGLAAACDSEDMVAFFTSHVRLHTAIYTAAGNSRLEEFLPLVRISTQMWYARLGSRPDRLEVQAHEHRSVVEAITSGDGAEAERLARHHIQESLRTWEGPDTNTDAAS
jgi:GntR family transcriptional regulator, vanillate catabolism transcriptional regulator